MNNEIKTTWESLSCRGPYSSSQRPFLFDGEIDDRFPPLDRVVGVTVNGIDKAYPFRPPSGLSGTVGVLQGIGC